jgi:sugar (pentulose or hexulose) kinase
MGAESGRAVLGRLQAGNLTTEELHRFANEPVQYNGELHWDVPRLWLEIQKGLALAASTAGMRLSGIGLDAWGVDYALLGENGALLGNPFHYRDSRTSGVIERVCAVVSREEIYRQTGIQVMEFNTLYQLYAGFQKTPKLYRSAERLLTIPDLFNFWLTGQASCEFTIATTTQFYNPRQQRWATELLQKLGLPTHFLLPVIQPGTVLAPLAAPLASQTGAGAVPVIAPACHDTGSAVAAVHSADQSVFISSGTWSVLGTELTQPVINSAAQHLNFTNEGGVCGTFRLQKNIAGLWLLQGCRREWRSRGQDWSYGELVHLAEAKPGFRSLVDPDHTSFVRCASMPETISRFCRMTEQPEPEDAAAYTRAILESLALKYRFVLEALEQLTGKPSREIHIVGGGAKNQLLNQLTADATGRRVIAGPTEATALGNIGMQMLANGAANSLREVREVIARSFPAQVYEPREIDKWPAVYKRFREYCEVR